VAALAKALGIETVPISHDSGRFWLQPGIVKKPGTITMTIHPPMTETLPRKVYLKALENAIEGDPA
jgi:hypothetical protein